MTMMKRTDHSYLPLVVGFLLAGFSTAQAAQQPPKDRISMDQAKSVALKEQAGSIKSSELEHEKGQWVYSFDIRSKDNQIHEVLVNAKSGKVISHTTETQAQEASEKKAEESGR